MVNSKVALHLLAAWLCYFDLQLCNERIPKGYRGISSRSEAVSNRIAQIPGNEVQIANDVDEELSFDQDPQVSI